MASLAWALAVGLVLDVLLTVILVSVNRINSPVVETHKVDNGTLKSDNPFLKEAWEEIREIEHAFGLDDPVYGLDAVVADIRRVPPVGEPDSLGFGRGHVHHLEAQRKWDERMIAGSSPSHDLDRALWKAQWVASYSGPPTILNGRPI